MSAGEIMKNILSIFYLCVCICNFIWVYAFCERSINQYKESGGKIEKESVKGFAANFSKYLKTIVLFGLICCMPICHLFTAYTFLFRDTELNQKVNDRILKKISKKEKKDDQNNSN
mgnify:CR=1 FL=1